MSISVQCLACRFTFRVPDDLAGRRVRCKDCGDPVSVPLSEPVEEPSRRRSGRSSSLPALLFIGIGMAAVVLVIGVAGFLFLIRGDPMLNGPLARQPVAIPPQPGMLRPDVPAAVGEEIYTLTNPRHGGGAVGPGRLWTRASYEVDYSLKSGNRPEIGQNLYLVARAHNGRAEMSLFNLTFRDHGTISFREFIGHLTGQMEIFIERTVGVGNPARERISNIVTLQAS